MCDAKSKQQRNTKQRTTKKQQTVNSFVASSSVERKPVDIQNMKIWYYDINSAASHSVDKLQNYEIDYGRLC